MVLRCAWGTCNADERYPQRLEGGRFILFPKPKTEYEKCLRWIKACGRPHEQLNVSRINKHKAVCSKHFIGGNGPTSQFPDPVPADGSQSTPTRPPPKKRRLFSTKPGTQAEVTVSSDITDLSGVPTDSNFDKWFDTDVIRNDMENVDDGFINLAASKSTQTTEPWISPLELLTLTTELHSTRELVEEQKHNIDSLNFQIEEKDKKLSDVSNEEKNSTGTGFRIDEVLAKETQLKGLFKYYTGITYTRFESLFNFLIPDGYILEYEKGRRDISILSQKDGLFLTLCRLRHDFGLKDLSMRFGLSLQSTGVVFNKWIDHMYYKFGQLSIWPNRDVIVKNMPKDFKSDFPTTLVIIDGTELKTQIPCALGLQSQMYSDYKSSTTLKALIGCDPNGSVIFVSELFTGSISDKAITERSGFYETISRLKSEGYINDGDAVMADKGFTIKDELNELGILLNIPPFAASGSQMTVSDTNLTQKIARHRVHIERLIKKVKTFKIISHTIPTSLFQRINKVWTVCCYITLFQDIFVKDL